MIMRQQRPSGRRPRLSVSRALPFLLIAVLAVSVLAGCGCGSGSGSGSSQNKSEEWVQTAIYLGLDIPGDGVVTEADFQLFLEQVVSVEFPLGMTVFDAYGQMMEDDGSIEKQSTKVIQLVHLNDDASAQAVGRVIDTYRGRFGGPQAMRTTSPIEVEFFQGNSSAVAKRQAVVPFVQEAVDYARANGKEKALAEFSDPNGSFKRGELYIYAYDFNANVIAHGGDASLIGKNLIDYTDPNGVKVIQGLIEVAQGGEGWFTYTWNNPQTGQQEPKLGYVMKVDDTWWLGSGTYGN
jgi:cytochrome c